MHLGMLYIHFHNCLKLHGLSRHPLYLKNFPLHRILCLYITINHVMTRLQMCIYSRTWHGRKHGVSRSYAFKNNLLTLFAARPHSYVYRMCRVQRPPSPGCLHDLSIPTAIEQEIRNTGPKRRPPPSSHTCMYTPTTAAGSRA
jgi:hypothetical protein